jgi:N utilization substance protein A
MIPNALQPAAIEEVFLYARLGRAIVLVKEDQLSLAIGRRGQNVRLASKLVGWDIEIMTLDELNQSIEKAEHWFKQIPGVEDHLVETFSTEGFLSFDDLTFLEPAQMGELAGITEEQAEEIIAFAEEAAERVEEETRAAREAEEAAQAAAPAAAAPAKAASPLEALFPDQELVAAAPEAKPTLDQLFGPDTGAAPEHSLSAAQVFGEGEKEGTTAPATQEEK